MKEIVGILIVLPLTFAIYLGIAYWDRWGEQLLSFFRRPTQRAVEHDVDPCCDCIRWSECNGIDQDNCEVYKAGRRKNERS